MRTLSKSIDEYLAAGGWSSSLFLEHAKALFEDVILRRSCTFEVGRSVIYIRSQDRMLKVYAHHNGRSKEYITFTTEAGDEVFTFHYMARTMDIKLKIVEYFQGAPTTTPLEVLTRGGRP